MASLRDNPIIDIGISLSVLGLLCTVVLEVIKVHERIARLEQRIELSDSVTKGEYNGDMTFLRYRLTRLEDMLLEGGSDDNGNAR